MQSSLVVATNAARCALPLSDRSAAALVEAIVTDAKALVPVSVRCEGEYGVRGLAIGVPAFVGAQGVTRILELDLSPSERAAFEHSAALLRTAHERLTAGAA